MELTLHAEARPPSTLVFVIVIVIIIVAIVNWQLQLFGQPLSQPAQAQGPQGTSDVNGVRHTLITAHCAEGQG